MMHSFKVTFFGKPGAGKSKLLRQIERPGSANFHRHDVSILGSAFRKVVGKIAAVDENITLDLWGVSNSERIKLYLPYSDAGVYCLDLSESIDLEVVRKDIELFKQMNSVSPLILVGTKCDAIPAPIEASKRLDEIARTLGFSESVVCSAKTLEGVADVKQRLFTTINNQVNALDLLCIADKLKGNVALYDAFTHLHKACKDLSPQKYNAITLEAKHLISVLASRYERNKITAIEHFKSSCLKQIKNPHADLNIMVMALFATSLTVLVAGAIGFTIGFIAGLWTGPGAFISAIASGYVLANAVLTASCALGLTLGVLSYNHLSQEHPSIAALESVYDEAKKWEENNYSAKLTSDSFRYFLSGFIASKQHRLQKKGKEKNTSKSLQLALDFAEQLDQGSTVKEVLSAPKNLDRLPKNGTFFSMATLEPLMITAADDDYVPIRVL